MILLLFIAPDRQLSTDDFSAALSDQGSVIAGADGEASVLQQILGGSSEVGATLNNANVVKAFVVGLPFWGV